MGVPASSTAAEIYMQAYERTAITMAQHPPKVWEQFVDDIYSVLKWRHLENFFHHINNLHQSIKFTMEGESNGELAFLVTLLKQNNGEISVLLYRKPTHTDQYLHYSSHHQTSCKESVVSSLFSRAYSIITNKDDLHNFLCENCNPSEKSHPLFPSNPPVKVEFLSSPPLFWKFGWRLNPLPAEEGRGAHYIVMMIENISGIYILIWYHDFQPFCCCKGRVILLQIVYHHPLQTDLTTLDSSHLIRFSCWTVFRIMLFVFSQRTPVE